MRRSGSSRDGGGEKEIGGCSGMGDEMVLQVKVEDVMVALVLPPVEGEEQGEVVG
jgi:hypothetical protein